MLEFQPLEKILVLTPFLISLRSCYIDMHELALPIIHARSSFMLFVSYEWERFLHKLWQSHYSVSQLKNSNPKKKKKTVQKPCCLTSCKADTSSHWKFYFSTCSFVILRTNAYTLRSGSSHICPDSVHILHLPEALGSRKNKGGRWGKGREKLAFRIRQVNLIHTEVLEVTCKLNTFRSELLSSKINLHPFPVSPTHPVFHTGNLGEFLTLFHFTSWATFI